MGAVQKLATMVIVGLVALATVLVVYLAADGGRRDSEAADQDHLAIERGTELYITYCLQCHGPSGYGLLGKDEPARVGGVLNQASLTDEQRQVTYQSDSPADQTLAEEFIRFRLHYGVPPDPRNDGEVAMPAFGQELNVEEINDLVYLIMNGDWDYVYNQSLLSTGAGVAQAECDDGDADACERVEDPEPVYPTVPPPAATPAEGDAAGSGDAGGASAPATGEEGGVVLEAQDPYDWSQSELTLAPGDTLQVVNAGVSPHTFVVDELGISEELSSDPVTITIPEDAAPGEYRFYCDIPGHAEQGMVGTLTITGG